MHRPAEYLKFKLHRLKRCTRLFIKSRHQWYHESQVKPPFPIKIDGTWHRIQSPNQASQQIAFMDVCIDDCYWLNKVRNAQLILDVGANVGLFSLSARAAFPNSRIIAFEPNPNALKYLIPNCEDFDIEIIPKAFGAEDGAVRFHASSKELGHASLAGNEGDGNSVVIEQMGWSSLNPDQPIDLLKLDCEGCEWDVLFNTDILERVEVLAMEYHILFGYTLEQLLNHIRENGLKALKQVRCDDKTGSIFAVRTNVAPAPEADHPR